MTTENFQGTRSHGARVAARVPTASRVPLAALARLAANVSLAAIVVLTALAVPAAAQTRPGGGGFGQDTREPALDDPFLFHVLRRTTHGPDAASLAEIRRLGPDEFLWRQLHPEWIDDQALEDRLAAELPASDDVAYQWPHLRYEFVVRSAFSERQLQQVMTQFWENHFDTVVPFGGDDPQRHAWTDTELVESRLLRERAFGRFRDLLETSAKSQAMMFFLDNFRNAYLRGNENYARELLELHSLGVDCGYDQQDVEEVARIFTGWTGVYLVRDPSDPTLVVEDTDGDGDGDFVFHPAAHDPDAKEALGRFFPAGGGLEEGEAVLDMVSAHPCTARFISTKLLELFVTDSPSEELVDRIAGVYTDTGGDVRQVLWSIFQSPEFRDPALFGGKVRTPLEFTLAAIRGVEADVNTAQQRNYDYQETFYFVRNQGMELFRMDVPTGFPETAPSWVTANGFLQRWKYADVLMQWRPSSTRPTWTDPMAVVVREGLETADEVIDHYTRLLLGRTLEGPRRERLRVVLLDGAAEFDPAAAGQDGRLREMVAHVLGAPELNKQ